MTGDVELIEGIEMLKGLGIPSLVVVAVMIIVLVYIQRDKFKGIIWGLVLEASSEIEEYIKGELTESEAITREWIYSLYDAIPSSLRIFISRKGYEKLVDNHFEYLYTLIFEDIENGD